MPEGDEPASTRRDVENLTFLCASRRFPTLANPWLSHANRRARTASLAAEQIGVALVNVPDGRPPQPPSQRRSLAPRRPSPRGASLVSPPWLSQTPDLILPLILPVLWGRNTWVAGSSPAMTL